MADAAAQIKSRLNLSDVIGGYLKLQKTGANFKARCPFHNEKTPSFHINTERQIWHCFGCSKGGDVFSFVQDIEGIDFPEALRILAARAGVTLEPFRSGAAPERSRRGVLLSATARANAFFVKQLWHSDAGERARAYLAERGFRDDTVRAWGIGWAPNDWQALNSFLLSEGFAGGDAVQAGLASEKNGRLYDRFRGRIMFPIADHNGQVVGFAGRIFGRPEGEAEPKYINTPQTPLYDKGKVLFGLDKAKLAVRQADSCVLVEGNTDVILAHQAGVQNTVATSGTALTTEQVRILGRYTKNVRFCFDGDQAGAAATRRGIALAIAGGMDVRVAVLDDPACKDPADYVRAHGAGFSGVISASSPAIQHYLDRALASYDPSSATSKSDLLASVGPFITRLTSKVQAAHWTSQLAAVLRSSPEDVRADLASLKDDLADAGRVSEAPGSKLQAPSVPAPQVPDPLEQALLSLLMTDLPRFHGELAVIDASWFSPDTAALIRELSVAELGAFSWDAFIKGHDDGTWRLEFALVRAQELWHGVPADELERQWRLVISRLGQRHLQGKARVMEMDIRAAEDRQDHPRLKALLVDFSRLRQDIARLFRI